MGPRDKDGYTKDDAAEDTDSSRDDVDEAWDDAQDDYDAGDYDD